jgi:hypothetical protein
MARVEINPEVAHLIIVPLPRLTYRFEPDGNVFVGEKRHKYFSRPEPRHEIIEEPAAPSAA